MATTRARSERAGKERADRGGGAELETYRRKRDFTRTPEPPPSLGARVGAKAPAERLTFMVHKHDARRLHYDLRLEMDGALASWAVPKGPSYNPRERRLAVQTEDHPLEYGGFEGRIPEGEYGAGDSIIWDRGTYQTVPPGQGPAMRAKGHLQIELFGEKLKGRWHLVRTRSQGGKAQWILFKAGDEHVSESYDVVADRPESVVSGRRVTRGPAPVDIQRRGRDPIQLLIGIWPPAEARPAAWSALRRPGEHVFEARLGGERALAAVGRGTVALQTGGGRDLAARFPQIARAVLDGLKGFEAVVDGELVTGGGRRPRLLLFDLLWLDGEDLRERPVEERRELLQAIVEPEKDELAVAPALDRGEGEPALLEQARRSGATAILARRKGSRYSGGAGPDWVELPVEAGAGGTAGRDGMAIERRAAAKRTAGLRNTKAKTGTSTKGRRSAGAKRSG